MCRLTHRANYGENLLESLVGCGRQLDGTTRVLLDDHCVNTLSLSIVLIYGYCPLGNMWRQYALYVFDVIDGEEATFGKALPPIKPLRLDQAALTTIHPMFLEVHCNEILHQVKFQFYKFTHSDCRLEDLPDHGGGVCEAGVHLSKVDRGGVSPCKVIHLPWVNIISVAFVTRERIYCNAIHI